MGKKNKQKKKADDDYWETEYLNDVEVDEDHMPGQAASQEEGGVGGLESGKTGEEGEEGESGEDVAIVDLDAMEGEDDDDEAVGIVGEEGAEGTDEEEEDEDEEEDWEDDEEEEEYEHYTYSELETVAAKVVGWLKKQKELDRLPATRVGLVDTLGRSKNLCSTPRAVPTLHVLQFLIKSKFIEYEPATEEAGEAISYHFPKLRTKAYLRHLEALNYDVREAVKKITNALRARSGVDENKEGVEVDAEEEEESSEASEADLPASQEDLVLFIVRRCKVPIVIPADNVVDELESQGVITMKEVKKKSKKANLAGLMRMEYNDDILNKKEAQAGVNWTGITLVVLLLMIIIPSLMGNLMHVLR